MAISSVFYAAFGYLSLVGAILWGMLFVGCDMSAPNMDAAATAAPLPAEFADGGLLLLLALLHRSVSRGMLRRALRRLIPPNLERSTQAWAVAAVLGVIYVFWQPLPHVLWRASGSLQWVLLAIFYVSWTLILIGTFLAGHLELFDIAGTPEAKASSDHGYAVAKQAHFTDSRLQPLYGGILLAVWANSVLTVGHLLLAAAVTAYVLCDALWAVRKTNAAREFRRALSLQSPRAAG